MGVLAVEIKIPKGPAALKLLRARWELATHPPTPSPTSILWTAETSSNVQKTPTGKRDNTGGRKLFTKVHQSPVR